MLKLYCMWLNFKERLTSDEKGQGLLEYTLLLVLILLLVIASIQGVGKWIGGVWTAVNTKVTAITT